jgi:para-nitrobenzyl esterase
MADNARAKLGRLTKPITGPIVALMIVETKSGLVEGRPSKGGGLHWLGIPYARVERFAAPLPVVAWAGARDATVAGRQCPQMFGNKASRAMLDPATFDEDCLSLNIYVPEGGANIGNKPVYVWIHGGAFVVGTGSAYDGTELAQSGDIIVVTINYRVGVLGFVNFGEVLGLPDIQSNLGLRDQIAALEWVRSNIAAFGGDSTKVTIGGQSAGSMSVSLLMHIKSAWPLFRGAIMQSGALSLIHSHSESQRIAHRYAEILELNQGSFETLKSMDLKMLFAAQGQVGAENPGGIPAAPWFDDDLLPASLDAANTSPAAPVPLIAGATRDEIRLFEIMPGDILPSQWPVLERLLNDRLGDDHAARILKAYPRTTAGRRALATDLTFFMPTRNFAHRHARHQPTWFYRFDYSHPIAGATHGLDLTLTWPMPSFRAALARGGSMKGKRAALGARMNAHYAHFVRTGKAGADWPAYRPSDAHVKIFNLEDRIESDPEAIRFAAWAGKDVGPGLS